MSKDPIVFHQPDKYPHCREPLVYHLYNKRGVRATLATWETPHGVYFGIARAAASDKNISRKRGHSIAIQRLKKVSSVEFSEPAPTTKYTLSRDGGYFSYDIFCRMRNLDENELRTPLKTGRSMPDFVYLVLDTISKMDKAIQKNLSSRPSEEDPGQGPSELMFPDIRNWSLFPMNGVSARQRHYLTAMLVKVLESRKAEAEKAADLVEAQKALFGNLLAERAVELLERLHKDSHMLYALIQRSVSGGITIPQSLIDTAQFLQTLQNTEFVGVEPPTKALTDTLE